MVRDKYAVRLAPEQREELQHLIRVGKRPARVTARARILLKSDDGCPAPQVTEALDVALGTVYRVKQRFTEEGLAGVLKDRPQANRRRKLYDRGEAHLIALACSPPPAGHALVKERNAAQATIQWRFNTQDARTKLHRLYPFDSKVD